MFDFEFYKVGFWILAVSYLFYYVGSRGTERRQKKEIKRLEDLVKLQQFEHRAELKRLDLVLRAETSYTARFEDEYGSAYFPEHEKQPAAATIENEEVNEPWQSLMDKVDI